MAERVLGNANAAGLANRFQLRRDVYALARQSAVALLDDVSKVHADAKNDTLLGGHASVALDEAGLNLDGRMHRFDDAAKFRDEAVAVALGDAAAVRRNGRIYKIDAQGARSRERALLVGCGHPAVTDDAGNHNRCEPYGAAHDEPPARRSGAPLKPTSAAGAAPKIPATGSAAKCVAS